MNLNKNKFLGKFSVNNFYDKIQDELTIIKENPDNSQYLTSLNSAHKDNQSNEDKENLLNSIDYVSRDVHRTFRFNGKYSSPLLLRRVLESISLIKRDVGYCQGMNFIAGGLLNLTGSEEKSFWLFLIFLKEYELNSLFIKVTSPYNFLHMIIRKCLNTLSVYFN